MRLWTSCALTVAAAALACGGGSTPSDPDAGTPDAGPVATSFTVGGTVTGLAGSGLLLAIDSGDPLPIAADGPFTFDAELATGDTYTVTVQTQPTDPSQTCTMANGEGEVAGANVTNVTVTCVTDTFAVGGTVTGLAGTGLLLRNNGADDTSVAPAATTFTFPTRVASNGAFAVTIASQPAGPSQTCTLAGASGTVVAADVTSVVVNCATDRFAVGGTVAGLEGTVELAAAGETVTVTANGAFAFPPLEDGTAYEVTITAQPTTPKKQTCTVANGTGTLAGAQVDDVEITCTTDTFPVGGTVTGLAAGATLELRNGATETVEVDADGAFVFATRVASGDTYDVTVTRQPAAPKQTCTVANGTGTVGAAAVEVTVVCATDAFRLGGTVSGLVGTVVLETTGGREASVATDGAFQFASPIPSGTAYEVTVKTQPATQTCVVADGTGTITDADVATVAVTCTTNTRSVGGNAAGLTGPLVLRNNGVDEVTLPADGAFVFGARVDQGSGYAVTVHAAPAGQSCSVANGVGVAGATDVANVAVTCGTDLFAVGGTVAGLDGTVVLAANLGETLTISADGEFAFTTEAPLGTEYEVTVQTQPATQLCTVANGAGTIGSEDVTDVTVTCVDRYSVGGTVSGLGGGSVVLHNRGADPLTVTADGPFAFPTRFADATPYDVTVATAPANRVCTVTGGTGTIAGANVTNVTVACVDPATVFVLRLGDGSGPLTSAAAPVFLDEYRLGDGFLVRSIAVAGLTNSGNATSEGALQRSVDGRFLTFAGYASPVGTLAVKDAADPRVVGRLAADGAVDTSTQLTGAFLSDNVRGAISTDGSAYWVAGTGASGSGGVWHVAHGSTTPTQVVTTPGNARVPSIFGGALYVSGGAGGFAGLSTTGNLPTTATTATLLPGFPGTSFGPYGFVLLDTDAAEPGLDTAYVAVDSSSAAALNVQRWRSSGGTWARETAFAPTGVAGPARGLSVTETAGVLRFVVITGGATGQQLVTFDVDGSTLAPTVRSVVTAGTGTAFRGAAFPPVAP